METIVRNAYEVTDAAAVFEPDGPLHGFDPSARSDGDAATPRGGALYMCLEIAQLQSPRVDKVIDWTFGSLPDGRWAVLEFAGGLRLIRFAVEEPRFRPFLPCAGRGWTVEDRCDNTCIVTGRVPWSLAHAIEVAEALSEPGDGFGGWTWEEVA